jgi:methionine-rich copper-binding protein CopC
MTMTTPTAPNSTRSRPAHPHRLLARLVVLVLLTLAAGVGLAGPASAHNVLTSSDPTDGSTLQTAPTTVRLTFDQPVQNFEPVVTVIGPDGQRYEAGAPQVDSTVVTADVNPLPAAGGYTIAYRVVSADGHPVQGEIKFELAEAAIAPPAPVSSPAVAGTPAASPGTVTVTESAPASASSPGSASVLTSAPVSSVAPTTSTAAVAPAASSSGLSGWVWAAIAVAAILIIAAIVVIVRRPRQPE